MIEASGLTKTFGRVRAVDGLSFQVEPGRVTGFLGPNGAGKSTTLRMILGLDVPTSGTATVNGRPYREAPVPLREVGALLDPRALQGDRTARNHLLWLARAGGIPARRVEEVLDTMGLAEAAGRRVKGFSLGMAQRLGIAAALLGDPRVVILDEPINGLDTAGIRWVRDLLRELADRGRTVLLSSHIMSEMELIADQLIVIGRGRLIADLPMREFIDRHSTAPTLVRSPHRDRLTAALHGAGARVRPEGADGCLVEGPDAAQIGALAAAHRVTLHELTPRRSTLEEIYTELTRSHEEYVAGERRAS